MLNYSSMLNFRSIIYYSISIIFPRHKNAYFILIFQVLPSYETKFYKFSNTKYFIILCFHKMLSKFDAYHKKKVLVNFYF